MNEIEELEKILAEKIEKDEEWDILVIGEVKLRYVGKSKTPEELERGPK